MSLDLPSVAELQRTGDRAIEEGHALLQCLMAAYDGPSDLQPVNAGILLQMVDDRLGRAQRALEQIATPRLT